MKKLNLFITAALIGSTVFAQVTVPKIISTTTSVKDIYINNNNRLFMYVDNQSHKMTSNSAGTIITTDPVLPMANNIGSNEFLFGDTLSATGLATSKYYGNSSNVFNSSNTVFAISPVNALTRNNDTTYALRTNTSSSVIMKINNGNPTTFIGSNSTNMINYSDLDYFELNGTRYIAIIYNNGVSNTLSLVDLDAGQYFKTTTIANSVTFSTNTNKVFYSIGNEIYEIINIVPNPNPAYQDITSTVAYNITSTQTINEFEFFQDAFANDSIYIAADDGVYSKSERYGNIITSIEDLKETSFITIYPNPSNQYLNVNDVKTNTPYQIQNQLGKLVLEGKITRQINIEKLTKGIYFLSIEGYAVQKFIKQ